MPSPLFRNFNMGRKEQEKAAAQAAQAKRSGGTSLGGYLRTKVANAVMKKLGPVAGLISALLRPGGKSLAQTVEQEVQAAQGLIQEMASTTRERVFEPPEPIDPMVDSPFWREQPAALVEPEILVESSNVYSISFRHSLNGDGRTGDLLVRFRSSDKARSGPGALYAYRGVRYEMFQDFQIAASKGSWVWDHLRLRGTMDGHQYPYDLVTGEPGGYIPRQIAKPRGSRDIHYVQRAVGRRTSTLPPRAVTRNRGTLPGWGDRDKLNLRSTR